MKHQIIVRYSNRAARSLPLTLHPFEICTIHVQFAQ